MTNRPKAKEVGLRIKLMRTRNGYSQKELADKIGVHQSTITQIETGGNYPGIETLFAIADILGVRAGELLDGTGIFI